MMSSAKVCSAIDKFDNLESIIERSQDLANMSLTFCKKTHKSSRYSNPLARVLNSVGGFFKGLF